MMPCLLLAALFLYGEPPPPVAMVLSREGTITWSPGEGETRQLRAMDVLRRNDRLETAAGATAIVLFIEDGHRERLKPGKKVDISKKGFLPRNEIELLESPSAALSAGNLSSLRGLIRSGRGAVGVVRGNPPPKPQVVTPMFAATVLTDRPTLTWRTVDGADDYGVELLNGTGRRVLWRESTKEPRLSYPQDKVPLALGRKFIWRVTARLSDERSSRLVESKFFTATKSQIDELSALTEVAADDEITQLLIVATVYEAHGVFDKALQLYRRLAEKAPHEANFHATLANYFQRSGLLKEAKASRERAKQHGWRPMSDVARNDSP